MTLRIGLSVALVGLAVAGLATLSFLMDRNPYPVSHTGGSGLGFALFLVLVTILGLIVMVVGLVLAGVGALAKRPGEGTPLMLWLGVACLGLVPLGPLSAQNPELRVTLKGHTGPVFSVAFSPDGKTLATESEDQRIRLWDVKTGKERVTEFEAEHVGVSTAMSPGPPELILKGKLWGRAVLLHVSLGPPEDLGATEVIDLREPGGSGVGGKGRPAVLRP